MGWLVGSVVDSAADNGGGGGDRCGGDVDPDAKCVCRILVVDDKGAITVNLKKISYISLVCCRQQR